MRQVRGAGNIFIYYEKKQEILCQFQKETLPLMDILNQSNGNNNDSEKNSLKCRILSTIQNPECQYFCHPNPQERTKHC